MTAVSVSIWESGRMLIEFSGPSASGKSAFVRYLLRELPEAYPVRRSMAANGKRPARQLWKAVAQLRDFPTAFSHAWKWHRSATECDRSSAYASFLMSMEYCVLKGASRDSKLWLLDQGRLQLGQWVTQAVWNNPVQQAPHFKRFIRVGDGVVLISMSPELLLERIHKRGDAKLLEQKARRLRYSSGLEFLRKDLEQQEKRIALAMWLDSPVLNLIISDQCEIQARYHHPEGCSNQVIDHWLKTVANAFIGWWKP
jgi:hypothetical protein